MRRFTVTSLPSSWWKSTARDSRCKLLAVTAWVPRLLCDSEDTKQLIEFCVTGTVAICNSYDSRYQIGRCYFALLSDLVQLCDCCRANDIFEGNVEVPHTYLLTELSPS
jgi:hypothetical protein